MLPFDSAGVAKRDSSVAFLSSAAKKSTNGTFWISR
jgi:hypothetical protein